MDRRGFLGALAAIGLVPRGWLPKLEEWEPDLDVAATVAPPPPSGPTRLWVGDIDLQCDGISVLQEPVEISWDGGEWEPHLNAATQVEVATRDGAARKLYPLYNDRAEVRLRLVGDDLDVTLGTVIITGVEQSFYYDRDRPEYAFRMVKVADEGGQPTGEAA